MGPRLRGDDGFNAFQVSLSRSLRSGSRSQWLPHLRQRTVIVGNSPTIWNLSYSLQIVQRECWESPSACRMIAPYRRSPYHVIIPPTKQKATVTSAFATDSRKLIAS